MSRRTVRPPQHGQIRVSTLKIAHAKRHLASMTASAAEVRDYGRTFGYRRGLSGIVRERRRGGRDYQTSSTGNTGDADS